MVRLITLIMVLANVLNAGILIISFLGTSAANMLLIWGAGILSACCVAAGTQFFNPRDMDPMGERSQNALDNFTRGALLNGVLWGVTPFIVMNGAT